jgi:acyl CoA:acetate/3-ketoacid CoA transferase alpha subunit
LELEVSDKIKSLPEAVKIIPDGAKVALGGWVITRGSMAYVHEMIRQKKKALVASVSMGGLDADLLVGAGCVTKLIYPGGSLEPAFGFLNRINDAIVNGEIEAEEYTGTAMCFRYLAGALGIPYMPIKSLLGSDVLVSLTSKSADVKVAECPFTNEKLVLLRALNPDYAVVHVQRVDTEGNAWIYGPLWDTKEMAMASKKVIVTAEEVVDPSLTRTDPTRTIIPGHHVDVIVHVPYGAHPTALYKYYDHDAEHIALYAKASGQKETFERYLEEYVLAIENHEQYLHKIGIKKLSELRADPMLGY